MKKVDFGSSSWENHSRELAGKVNLIHFEIEFHCFLGSAALRFPDFLARLAGQHFMTGGRVASCGAGLVLCIGNGGLYLPAFAFGDACSQTFVRICAISRGPCQFVGLMHASFKHSCARDP